MSKGISHTDSLRRTLPAPCSHFNLTDKYARNLSHIWEFQLISFNTFPAAH